MPVPPCAIASGEDNVNVPFKVIELVPDVVPIVIKVVAVPFVPTLTLFMLVEAFTPVAMFVVDAAVVPINVNDVDCPNAVIAADVPVNEVAFGKAIVAF